VAGGRRLELGAGDEETGGMRTYARALASAAMVLLALGSSACGDDGGADESGAGGEDELADDTTSSGDDDTGTTTTAEPSPEDQAIAAYRAAYDAYMAALNPPNPQSADLIRTFSGEALTAIVDTVFRARDEGVYVVGSFEMHPEVVSATPSEVILADCVVETNTTYDAATRTEKDSGTYVHNRKATVVNTKGVWSVAAFEQLEEPCTPDAA
jgi:hypothetical protein